MTWYQLHQDGDCNPYTCPLCDWEEAQLEQELAEEQAPPE